MTSDYTIRMKNCAFFARHGVFDAEETLGQRFYVDAVLEISSQSPLEKDDIDATVDYGAAFAVIEEIGVEKVTVRAVESTGRPRALVSRM